MKFATIVCRVVVCLILLGTLSPLDAQNPIPFKHVVLVIQENRTPDNLFGAAPAIHVCGNSYPFEQGVDIQDGGPDNSLDRGQKSCLVSQPLVTCWDIGHKNTTWNNQARIVVENQVPVAKMDNACYNHRPMGPARFIRTFTTSAAFCASSRRTLRSDTSSPLQLATTPTITHPTMERCAFKTAMCRSRISFKANTGISLTSSRPQGWDRPISLAISDVLKTKGRSRALLRQS